jgi:hypothetical protein
MVSVRAWFMLNLSWVFYCMKKAHFRGMAETLLGINLTQFFETPRSTDAEIPKKATDARLMAPERFKSIRGQRRL